MSVLPDDKIPTLRLWIEKAEHDLKNAEYTLTLFEECPFDTICYHAQQCAEKYLKVLLLYRCEDFPKTHDLRLLLQRTMIQIQLKLEMGDILKLNRYAIEARYPGRWEPITRQEAEEAIAMARKIRVEIRKHLPQEAL
ncbi:HEPN domain-containing protein [bacterium]|nr:HEPN domain-containing protein [bacterium]